MKQQTPAEKVRRVRLAIGWSMEELARQSGTHRQTIWNYENGVTRPKRAFMQWLDTVTERELGNGNATKNR